MVSCFGANCRNFRQEVPNEETDTGDGAGSPDGRRLPWAEVRLADGSKLRGWISEVSDTGFELRYEKRKPLQQEQITFDQVKTVKQVNNVKTSHTARNVLIGVGIGVVAIGVVAAIALASGGGISLMGGGWGM
jgi:hypothetical protein